MSLFFNTQEDLSSFDESTEEGKLTKFDAICKKLRGWFFYDKVNPSIRIFLISKDMAAKNPYLNCIRNTVRVSSTFPPTQESGWNPETGTKVGLEEMILEVKTALVEFSGDALKFKKQRTTSATLFPLMSEDLHEKRYNCACEIVFWHLLAMTYDNFNDQELAKTEDLAFQIGFTKAMLRDWHKAVGYVLEGNVFDLKCELKFESEEAKIFFLHLYERSDFWEYDR